MRSHKIKSLKALAGVPRGKVVLCHGVYDLLHLGHVRHLEEAKTHGDCLVVTVTTDEYVGKGPGRPAFTAKQRVAMLAALECVDFVAVSETPTAAEAIRALKPAVYVKGAEYADCPNEEERAAALEVGCEMAYTSGEVFSSSALLNRHAPTSPDAAADWLRKFPHSAKEVNALLDACAGLKVLVAGEYIEDEYVWVKALGKSGKEPVLAVQELRRERHDGGAAAVFKHLCGFVANTRQWSGRQALRKTRFVEEYPMHRHLEVYNDRPLGAPAVDFPDSWRGCGDRDLVIVADYGHGLFGDTECLQAAKFLAVNVQNNAANHGYNTHEKYERIDYLCLSESELRLAARDRGGDLRELIEKAAARHSCGNVTVTRGRDGVLCWSYGVGFVEAPAFTDHFADRVGAGDAVLAVTSLLACKGAPVEVIVFVANAVGALAVNIIGNREPVKKAALQKYITVLLK